MTEREAHLRGIALARFDRLPRLVYADWLDERGTPDDAATAEFIRVGVELLAHPQVHVATVWCDCERCRLVRRRSELFDLGAAAPLIADSRYERAGFNDTFAPASYSGGFPFIATCRWGWTDLTWLPLAAGRLFLTLPVTTATVEFFVYGGRPVRRESWFVNVSVHEATHRRGGRVKASVGPVVGSNSHVAFACEYPVDHPHRVPTLVRKAVRRCLTNRTADSEHRPPPRRAAA